MTDTGLPALPEGQFWRVRSDRYGLILEIVLRTSAKTGMVLLECAVRGSAAEDIRHAAEHIKATQSLLGDYPPKVLP